MSGLNTVNLPAEEPDGVKAAVDSQALRVRLQAAFRQCSIDESWIADTMIDVLESKLQFSSEEGVVLSEKDAEAVLVNALRDSGYSDVAGCFAQSPEFREESAAQPGKFRTWRQRELRAELQREFHLDRASLAYLLKALPEAISALSFSEATPALIAELARHLLKFRPETTPAETPAASAVTQYISASQWRLKLPQESRALLSEGVLKLMPVSDILPIAVAECRLCRLYELPSPPQLELELIPRIYAISEQIFLTLSEMRRRMLELWPKITPPHAQVRFAEFEAFLNLAYPGRGRRRVREREQLRLKVTALLKASLCHEISFPVTLSFR